MPCQRERERERESIAKGNVSVERLPKEYNFFLPSSRGPQTKRLSRTLLDVQRTVCQEQRHAELGCLLYPQDGVNGFRPCFLVFRTEPKLPTDLSFGICNKRATKRVCDQAEKEVASCFLARKASTQK